jgi:hypothetical protein
LDALVPANAVDDVDAVASAGEPSCVFEVVVLRAFSKRRLF